MIEDLMKTLIFEKVTASKNKIEIVIKDINPLIITWQIYLRRSLEIFKSIGLAVSEKFCSSTRKTFQEKRI